MEFWANNTQVHTPDVSCGSPPCANADSTFSDWFPCEAFDQLHKTTGNRGWCSKFSIPT